MTFEYAISEHADLLHRECIVFDGHCDALLDILDGKRAWDRFEGKGQIDLPRMEAGGITAQIFATYVRPAYHKDAPAETLRLIETMHRLVECWSDRMLLATRADDVRRAKREGKIAGIISMEGADGLDGDLRLLKTFHRLGLRNIGLTWNHRNQVADGVAEIRTGGGLTEFGVDLVTEMRRLGIMVDIAHLAPAGVDQVFEVYDGPVIASHANAKAVCAHRRNLSDEHLKKIAACGGLVGVTYVPAFISGGGVEDTDIFDALFDHIDHIVKVAGIEHVALGSDWDGFFQTPEPFLQDVSQTPMITEGLIRRGYSDDHIHRFLGENWLRVFEEVAG